MDNSTKKDLATETPVDPYKAEQRRKGLRPRLQLSGISDVQSLAQKVNGVDDMGYLPQRSGLQPINWRGFSQVFAMTPPSPCPYLPDLMERKLVTGLTGISSQMSALNWAGFRRSHSLAYRPACENCNACQAARIIINDFVPSRSQKRILNQTRQIERRLGRAVATSEHYALFEDYVVTRHGDGEMAQMTSSDFRAMLEETPVSSMVIEWRDTDTEKLIGGCLVDVTIDGLSMVYSYFHPAYKIKSLGTFMILDLVDFSREKNLPYLYLGYWVKGSPKMDYKVKFKPLEVYSSQGWVKC